MPTNSNRRNIIWIATQMRNRVKSKATWEWTPSKTILSPSPALEKTKIGKLRRPQLRRPAWQSLRQTPPNSKTLELLLDIRHLFVSLHFEAKLFVAILGQDTVGCVDDKQIFLRIHGLLFIPLAQASRLWQRAHEPPCTRMECMTQAMAHS